MKKYMIVSLISVLTLSGCSKIDTNSLALTLPGAVVLLPVMLVGAPLIHGSMLVNEEIDYRKYYADQDYMIGKEYELTQDAFLYHDVAENNWLDKKHVESATQMGIVPSGTRLTVTCVDVSRTSAAIRNHEVFAKFSLQDEEIQANISRLFNSSYVCSNRDDNFIVDPSVMIEIVECSES